MFGALKSAPRADNDYSACSGCSLCLLVCPVWRTTHDLRLTPHGRAKALQHGASIVDIAASVESCTLCSACEPVCPENIDLVGMILKLRRQLPRSAALHDVQTRVNTAAVRPPVARADTRSVLLPDKGLRAQSKALAQVHALLACPSAEDDGADIALSLETGVYVPDQRIEQFLAPLRGVKHIIVADGLLLRHLKSWLPKSKISSLGVALIALPAVRCGLRATDLYVIEPRAYHSDQKRLVALYDQLRFDTGCTMNLDLLRIAIPAAARGLHDCVKPRPIVDIEQALWVVQGRKFSRVVAESVDDMAALSLATDKPVVHVSELNNIFYETPEETHRKAGGATTTDDSACVRLM